jgi:cytochrome c553
MKEYPDNSASARQQQGAPLPQTQKAAESRQVWQSRSWSGVGWYPKRRSWLFYTCFTAGFAFALFLTRPVAAEEQWPLSEEPLGVQLCMTCHGAFGQGSPVVGGPNLAGMEPWYLRRQLELFRVGGRGYEKAYIPAYEMRKTAEVFSDADIAELVDTITAWPAVEVSNTLVGDAGRGASLYQPCAACHGLQAEGNELLGAPALHNRNDWYLLKQLKLFKSGWRGKHPEDPAGAQMQVQLAALATEADMLDVLSYIGQLASGQLVQR